jgi:hypothetical protein
MYILRIITDRGKCATRSREDSGTAVPREPDQDDKCPLLGRELPQAVSSRYRLEAAVGPARKRTLNPHAYRHAAVAESARYAGRFAKGLAVCEKALQVDPDS